MKGSLVDTNIPSELTREEPDARVAAFLRNAGEDNVFLILVTRNVKDFAGLRIDISNPWET